MLMRLMLATALVAAPEFAFAKDDAATTAAAMPAVATPAMPATTGPQNTLQVVWTVFLGGINLGTVGLKSSFEGSNYAAVSRLKTAGVVNSFYASVIDASAVGTVEANSVHPQKYDSDYNGEKSNQKVSLAYMGAGIQLSSDPPYDVSRFPVNDEQKANTVDPLSAIIYSVSGVSASPDKPCGDTVRIFDGRRRYDVEFSYVGKENVSTAGPYSGPAIKCEMRYRQVAGFKPNLTKNNVLPTITVWFADMPTKDPGPVKSFLLAVKLMAETPFGAAVAHARKITIDGEEKGG